MMKNIIDTNVLYELLNSLATQKEYYFGIIINE